MAEWLHEESFGEKRALLIDSGHVRAARLIWRSDVGAGSIVMARVIKRSAGSKRAVCLTSHGTEVAVADLPRTATEGSDVRLMIHREPMAERGRLKRAQGRHFHDQAPQLPSSQLIEPGKYVARLPQGLWEDVWSTASDGEVAFPGGSLILTVTPAMTVIDVDGYGSPTELCHAAIPAIARALRWFDLGGNIGIDFPTITDKSGRKAVDQALSEALSDWPHERTAMNGFGFVHLVARLQLPSLLHRLEYSRATACARYLLRKATMVQEPGALLLTCNPAVHRAIADEWLIELQEITGRSHADIRFETKHTLALDAGFAQSVAR